MAANQFTKKQYDPEVDLASIRLILRNELLHSPVAMKFTSEEQRDARTQEAMAILRFAQKSKLLGSEEIAEWMEAIRDKPDASKLANLFEKYQGG